MARVPELLDVSVPLAAGLPAYPGNPAFELQPVKRLAEDGSSNVARRLGRSRVVEVTGRGGTPARVILKR